jgi:hypothetical protein
MSDWSDRALGKLQERSKNKQIQDEVWLEKQRVKKAQGIPIWHEIRAIVKKHVSDFNATVKMEQLFFEVTQNNEIRVRSEIEDHRQFLQASFDENTGKLTYECGAKKRGSRWDLSIVDGKVGFYWGMVPKTPDSIAEQMLDALID